MPFKGPARCIRTSAVQIEKGKQLYLEEARRRKGGFSFTHVPSRGHCKIPGSERADELAARGKANLNLTCTVTVGRFENCGPPSSARAQKLTRSPLAARSTRRLSYGISNRDPACLRTTVPSLLALDRRDIELGARILYDHCARWRMMPHTAGKTVAMYSGQPVVNLREFLPDEGILPIKMEDGLGEAPPA
jgi:hypothetical protein